MPLCEKCEDAPALEGKKRCDFCEDDTIIGDEKRYVKQYSLDLIRNELEWAVKHITSPLVTQEYRDVYKKRIAEQLEKLDQIKPNNS